MYRIKYDCDGSEQWLDMKKQKFHLLLKENYEVRIYDKATKDWFVGTVTSTRTRRNARREYTVTYMDKSMEIMRKVDGRVIQIMSKTPREIKVVKENDWVTVGKREVEGFFVSKNEEKKDGKVRAQVKFIYPDETGEIVREVDFDQIRLLRSAEHKLTKYMSNWYYEKKSVELDDDAKEKEDMLWKQLMNRPRDNAKVRREVNLMKINYVVRMDILQDIEVDVSKLDLKDISNKLMKTVDPENPAEFRELFYGGKQRVKVDEVIGDTLDWRRKWPLKPEHIGQGPDDICCKTGEKIGDENSPWKQLEHEEVQKWPMFVKLLLSGVKYPRGQEILVAHMKDFLDKLNPILKVLDKNQDLPNHQNKLPCCELWLKAARTVRDWLCRVVFDESAVYDTKYHKKTSGLPVFFNQIEVFRVKMSGVFKAEPGLRTHLKEKYSDVGLYNICVLMLYERTKWQAFTRLPQTISLNTYIKVFVSLREGLRYSCLQTGRKGRGKGQLFEPRLIRAAMFYFKIDPESYKNTWWANLYVIMADGHRLKDAVMGLFENCVFPTLHHVVDYLKRELQEKSNVLDQIQIHHITCWLCFLSYIKTSLDDVSEKDDDSNKTRSRKRRKKNKK
eukprot:g1177.t1